MKEKILELFIQCLPAIIAAFSCIIASFKLLNGINTWKDSINESNLKQLSKDMKNVVKRNLELHNQIEKLLVENQELKSKLEEATNNLIDVGLEIKNKAEEQLEEPKEE